MVSQPIIRALNFHAIAGLHHTAGTYRRHEVVVGTYMPPPHHRIDPLMDDFVNLANLQWRNTDPVRLAAFALWNLNNIHPFENGNGRTARALCYFILCAKLGGLLPGTRILPTLLAEEPTRSQYVAALAHADSSNDLDPLIDLIRELLRVQLSS